MLVAVVTLIVIGPKRLPETLRTLGLWFGRLRRSFNTVKTEIEREIGMDDIRRQLHNEAVMEEMKRIEQDVKTSLDPEPPKAATKADVSETTAETTADETTEAEVDTEPAQAEEPESIPNIEDTTPRPRSEAELEALNAKRHAR